VIGDATLDRPGLLRRRWRSAAAAGSQNGVSIYDGVTLEDDVFLGPSCVFTNVRAIPARTCRASGVRAHRGRPRRDDRANATIVCGVAIGAYAMNRRGRRVTRDVPPHGLMIGAPGAGSAGLRCGETLRPASAPVRRLRR